MADKTQETTQTTSEGAPKSKKGTFKKVLKYGGIFLGGAAVGATGTLCVEKFLIKGKKKNV